MYLHKPEEKIYLFTFKHQKEMALTFVRRQEDYESQKENLLKKSFSVFDFLNEEMDHKGKINYFNKWEGFNLPGKVFHDFQNSA